MPFPAVVRFLVFALYFVFVLLFIWVLDITSVICLGEYANRLLDPIKLSVSQLRQILDERGIVYENVVEKSELADIVQRSGGWTVASSPPAKDGDQPTEPIELSSSDQFQQDVVESNQVWVVEIIPESDHPIFREDKRMTIVKRLSRIGIMIGTVRCAKHRRLCIERKWRQPELLLSLPRNINGYSIHDGKMQRVGPATVLSLFGDSYTLSLKSVLGFINRKTTIQHVESLSEYENWRYNEEGRVKVLMLSDGKQAPLYFKILALQQGNKMDFAFTGHIKDRQDWMYRFIRHQNKSHVKDTVVLFTKEGEVRYGDHPADILTYRGLELYLSFLQPDIKQLIILSMILITQYVVIELVMAKQGITIYGILTTLQNIFLLNVIIVIFWVHISAVVQWTALRPVSEFVLSSGHYLAQTNFISWLRWLLIQLPNYWHVFAISYSLYSVLVYMASRLFWKQIKSVSEEVSEQFVPEPTVQSQVNDGDPFDNLQEPMFRVTINNWLYQQHFHPFSNQRGSASDIVVDQQLHALLEELATALPHVLDSSDEETRPTEYIKRLPTWKYSLSAQSKLRPAYVLKCKNCVICLADFRRGDYLCALPCGHTFHKACVVPWLETRSELCPVCRQPASKKV